MTFHKYRNLTPHTYDENTAKEVAGTCQSFSQACQHLIAELKSKND